MTNNKIQGNKIRSHEIPVCPSLHIKFNIHVQKRMYIILIINITAVFGTRHENDPIL